jgi:hypothetical protein
MKTHALRICLGVFLVLSGYSAHGQDATYDTDIDFSKFKTYKWVTLKSVSPIDSLTDEQIRTTLDAALASKGLGKIDGGNPADLLVGYQTSEQAQEQIPGIDADTGLRTNWVGKASSSWTIYKGELVLNMYDGTNRQLIWTRLASKNLDLKADAKKRQKNLNKAVQRLLKNYPPILVGGPHH